MERLEVDDMREVPPVDSAEQAGADEGGMEHEVSHESRSKFALMNGMLKTLKTRLGSRVAPLSRTKLGKKMERFEAECPGFCTAAHRKDKPSAVPAHSIPRCQDREFQIRPSQMWDQDQEHFG